MLSGGGCGVVVADASCVCSGPGGSSILLVGCTSGEIMVLRNVNKEEEHSFRFQVSQPNDTITCMCIINDDNKSNTNNSFSLFSGSSSGLCHVSTISTISSSSSSCSSSSSPHGHGHSRSVLSCVFIPHHHHGVVVTSSYDQSIIVWSISSSSNNTSFLLTPMSRLPCPLGPELSLSFSSPLLSSSGWGRRVHTYSFTPSSSSSPSLIPFSSSSPHSSLLTCITNTHGGTSKLPSFFLCSLDDFLLSYDASDSNLNIVTQLSHRGGMRRSLSVLNPHILVCGENAVELFNVETKDIKTLDVCNKGSIIGATFVNNTPVWVKRNKMLASL